MTKQHFIALADTIRASNASPDQSRHFSANQLDTLAHFCQTQNPMFNRTRWLDYIAGKCGPNGGAIK